MKRTGVNVVKRKPKPWTGGVGEISADVRAFWPPGTPALEVLAVLEDAYLDAEKMILKRVR